MNSLLKDGLISTEIQFSAHDICEKLRFARSVSGSASGSTLGSVNSVCDNNLLNRPGSGKKPRKGGNDPGFALLTARTKDVRAGRSRPFAVHIGRMWNAIRLQLTFQYTRPQ